MPYPVEYKVGRRKDNHPDVQLCAQALCLEEMLGVSVPRGAIYYATTRKRYEVVFDTALRERTIEIVQHIRAMLEAQQLPDAPNDARCPNCSLLNACLPHVVSDHIRLQRLQRALFQPMQVDGEDG